MIIENKGDEYLAFLEEFRTKSSFVDVIYVDDDKHPLNTQISLIIVKIIDGETYILPLFHNEAELLDPDIILDLRKSTTLKYTVDKKKLLYHLRLNGDVIDVSIRKYLLENDAIDLESINTSAHEHIKQNAGHLGNVNSSIPILKHKERFEKLYRFASRYFDGEINTFYNDLFVKVLCDLEKAGMYVNSDKFCGKHKNISEKGLVYTEYNMYTSTGRPSNRHGNVNFSALNKNDGTRNAFISRFDDEGELIIFDFDAYHIRLISKLIGHDLPNTSGHRWLAEQYFDGEVDDEQYESAKQLTFRMLYGGIDEELAEKVPYLKDADEFIDKLWTTAQKLGYIPAPLSDRKISLKHIQDVNRLKLFNYLLQLYETEKNIVVIDELLEALKGKKSKLILYTYDSFLFDVHKSETSFVMSDIKNILEKGGFPVHVQTGSSYNNMN